MEKWEVIGYRPVDFTDNSGKRVVGCKLYLARPAESDKAVGKETISVFFNGDQIKYSPVLGEEITLCWNRYGKLSDIVV